VDGKWFEKELIRDSRIDDKDELAATMVRTPFMHFIEGDKVTVVNLANVSYITVTEVQLAF
jgi:hypothetical protein